MILVCSFPPQINSAAHLYYELSESLKKSGHNITIITEFPKKEDNIREIAQKYNDKFFFKESLNGIDVFRLSTLSFLSKVPGGKALRYLLSCLLFAMRGVFTKKPDVILIYSPPLYMGLAGYIISKIKKTEFVFNLQDIHPKILIDMKFVRNPVIILILKKIEELIYRKAYAFIGYSKGNTNYLLNRGIAPEKVFMIPNWVDTDAIKPNDRLNDFRELNGLDDRFIVSYAGTMGRAQGLNVILDAVEILKRYEEIVFLLVGEGNAKPLLEKVVYSKELKNVILLPLQPKEEYVKILIASDICLLPLNRDLPLPEVPGKLANLMASGRPIIATINLGGDAAKIINEAGCGFCIEPGSKHKLVDAILALYNNKDLRDRMGKNGRVYAKERFSRGNCVSQYEKVLTLSVQSRKV